MEDVAFCGVCFQQFNHLITIPKILECGHTFCSPCLSRIFQGNAHCPNCRAKMAGAESTLTINYSILKVVDILKYQNRSVTDNATTNKLKEKRNIVARILTRMSSWVDLEKYLARMEDLTLSEREAERVGEERVGKIIDEIIQEYKKTVHALFSRDIKSTVSILLQNFRTTRLYLTEILTRIQNGEKIFAVRKVEDKIKYGKVSNSQNKLFFHSLTLSEVPKDATLLWFDELKQCAHPKNFYTFLEITCNNYGLSIMVRMKMFDKQLSHHFIKFCTGEYGPCFKGVPFKKDEDTKENIEKIIRIEYSIVNNRKIKREIEYNFSIEKDSICKCEAGQLYVYSRNGRSNFDIIYVKNNFTSGKGIFGKVIYPNFLKDCIDYDDSSHLKILDCGIVLEL
ncbi:UNVERIFIED_CONTAM: hypothetical protein RMT77_010904 [Armadillidium vulgare]